MMIRVVHAMIEQILTLHTRGVVSLIQKDIKMQYKAVCSKNLKLYLQIKLAFEE